MALPAKDPKTGTWTFDADWPPAAQQQWLAAQKDIEAEAQKLADTEAARAAAETSVEGALLAARIQADEARRAAAAAAHALEDDKAWLEAQATYGGRVARLFVGDRWLILKANTGAQWEKTVARSEKLVAEALEAGDDARARKLRDQAFQEGIFDDSLVSPDKASSRKLLDAYPAAWPEVYGIREQLNRGPREAAGKAGAR